jgi:hypothetical protein
MLNPHIENDPDKPVHSKEEIRRLDRQYSRRQRYLKKYGGGGMRRLRREFRKERREGNPMSFREWLRAVDVSGLKLSPKAAQIKAF